MSEERNYFGKVHKSTIHIASGAMFMAGMGHGFSGLTQISPVRLVIFGAAGAGAVYIAEKNLSIIAKIPLIGKLFTGAVEPIAEVFYFVAGGLGAGLLAATAAGYSQGMGALAGAGAGFAAQQMA